MRVMHHQHVRAQPCCSGRPPASYLLRLATKHPELSQTTWSRSCNPATRLAQRKAAVQPNPGLLFWPGKHARTLHALLTAQSEEAAACNWSAQGARPGSLPTLLCVLPRPTQLLAP